MPHALLVESDDQTLHPLADLAESEGFSASCARSFDEAQRELACATPDLVILNENLPDGTGIDLVDALASRGLTDVIVVTDQPSVDAAVRALRRRVRDYVVKPIDLDRVRVHLHEIGRRTVGQKQPALCKDYTGGFGPMLGNCDAMRRLYHMLERVAATDASVLITGESGTGKELIAQTIHDLSPRRDKPFIAINCGAVPANLIESELFGHEKGAFTGADRVRRGVFEQAAGGTLLLDEITEMPLDLQVKLLRVLESFRFMRVGGEKPIEVDVRITAASNRDMHQAVADGSFREDLLYRLSVFPLQAPPLRQRGSDIQLLAEHFLAQLNQANQTSKRLSPEAVDRLCTFSWPGNVRQLKNVVQHAYIMADEVIDVDALQLTGVARPSVPAYIHVPVGTSVGEMERRLIYATLRHFDGNKKQAAEALGISLKTLYNRLNGYRNPGEAETPGDAEAREREPSIV